MSSITCPHCQHTIESGQVYCPRCFLKLPGAMRQTGPPPVRRTPSAPRTPNAPRQPTPPSAPAPRADKPRLAGTPRPAAARAPRSAGECPACGHGITTADTWCKWCHWPVNRKT